MGKLNWSFLLLFALFGRLRSSPRASGELPAWSQVNNEDAKLNLETLTNRRAFQQTSAGRLGAGRLGAGRLGAGRLGGEDSPSQAGLDLPSSSAREYVREAPIGNMLLRSLWESARKQYKKRRNLSQCFWKYCV